MERRAFARRFFFFEFQEPWNGKAAEPERELSAYAKRRVM